ncbi:MAG: hypothetical protein R3F20_15490 [Planctomycetota bacterium]
MTRRPRVLSGLVLGAALAVLAPHAAAQNEEITPESVEVDMVDPLGDVASDMHDAATGLDREAPGADVIRSQRTAIAKLDKLVESLKKR